MEQFTQPEEGQSDRQETAATLGGLRVSGCVDVSKPIRWLSNALEIRASLMRV